MLELDRIRSLVAGFMKDTNSTTLRYRAAYGLLVTFECIKQHTSLDEVQATTVLDCLAPASRFLVAYSEIVLAG